MEINDHNVIHFWCRGLENITTLNTHLLFCVCVLMWICVLVCMKGHLIHILFSMLFVGEI